MTLRELADQLEIPRAVALQLAQRIPGAKKEATGEGRIPRWIIPDDALARVDEDLIEEARAAAQRPIGGPSAPVATAASALRTDAVVNGSLRDEELEVARVRLAAEKERAEADRCQAEAARLKAESDVERLRGAGRPTDSAAHLERLVAAIERKLDQAQALSGAGDQARMVSEAIKASAELTAHANPSGDSLVKALTDRKDDGLTLKDVVELLKPKDDAMAKAISMLKDLGVIGAEREEPEQEERPRTLFEQASDRLLQQALDRVLHPVSDPVKGEPTIVALAKVLSPYVAPIFADLAAAVKLYAESLKTRPVVVAANANPASAHQPQPAAMPAGASSSTSSQNSALAQLVAFVDSKASAGESTYQDVLTEFERLIPEGKPFLEQVRSGAMPPETAFQAVVAVLKQHGIGVQATTYDYLSRLFASLKPAQPETRYVCARKCEACGATVGYVSVDEAKRDTESCPKCRGKLGDGISEMSGSTENGAAA